MRIRSLVLALVLAAGANSVHAQDAALERVQNLINTGRLTEARSTLAKWERTSGDPTSSATPEDRARALFLTGVLSADPEAGENAYIGVVLSYPSSAVAPEALLRLGQLLYTEGSTARAISYLERLQSDYPASTARETGVLWLARAQLASGAAASACGTARDGLAGSTNPNLRTLIELERDRACAQSGGVARATASPNSSLPDLGIAVDGNVQDDRPPLTGSASPAAPPANGATPPRSDAARTETPRTETPRTDTQRNSGAANATVGEYGVQTAAFSQRQAADRIAAELKAKGFDARIVTVPGSALFRVRHGSFATSREAAAAALHVRDAGFATLVVNDVRLEKRQ